MKNFGLKVFGGAMVGFLSLALFMPAVANAQTAGSSDELTPELRAQLMTALDLLSITLGVLGVKMDYNKIVTTNVAGQQLAALSGNLNAMQNSGVLADETKKDEVAQVLSLNTQTVNLIETQADLVAEERARQISVLKELTDRFRVLTEMMIKLRAAQ